MIKTIPKKKKCKEAKWLSEEVLQIAEKRRSKKQERKGKIYTMSAEFQGKAIHSSGYSGLKNSIDCTADGVTKSGQD